MHPTQRRLMIALVVSLACLPLLVIDMFQRSPSSGASQTASSTDPSLVVASVSVEDSTTTTVAVTVPVTVTVTEPAPVTTVAPPTTVAPRRAPTTTTTQRRATTPPVPTGNAPASPNQWDRLAACETGGNWAANSGNGYGGGLQFAHSSGWSTWRAFGGEEFTAHPWEATREQQIVIAERVLARSGWGAWPGCMSR
ncbi:MAG: transglycosylase family protein [Microbacteriaceae bacterium]